MTITQVVARLRGSLTSRGRRGRGHYAICLGVAALLLVAAPAAAGAADGPQASTKGKEGFLEGEEPSALEVRAAEAEARAAFRSAQQLWSQHLLAMARKAGRAPPPPDDPRAAARIQGLNAECEVVAAWIVDLAHITTRYADALNVLFKARKRVRSGVLRGVLGHHIMHLRLRTGEIEKAQLEAKALGYRHDWRIIGPFDNERGGAFEIAYPPESSIRFDAHYQGKKRSVSWTRNTVRSPIGYVDLNALLRPNDECLAYAVTYLRSPNTRVAALRLASDDGIKVWVNDRLVLSRDVRRPATFDQDVVVVQLEKGWNKVLLKVSEQQLDWRFAVRFTELDGRPITDLQTDASQVRSTPEGRAAPAAALADTGARGYFEDRRLGTFTAAHGERLVLLRFDKSVFEALVSRPAPVPHVSLRDKAIRQQVAKAIASAGYLSLLDRLGARALPVSSLRVARERFYLAEVYRHRRPHDVEQHPDREAMLEAIRLAPDDARFRYHFAQVVTEYATMSAEVDENRRRGALEAAARLDPNHARARYELARHYYVAYRNYRKAEPFLNAALQINPDFVQARMLEAEIAERRGWAAEEERLIRRLARQASRNAHVLNRLGSIETAADNPDQAMRAYQRALDIDFTYATARDGLIGAHLNLGRIYRALDEFDQALRIDPYDSQTYVAKAELYQAKEDYSSAIDEYHRALAICGEDHDAIAQLGHALYWVGKKDEAREHWTRALKLQPNFVALEKYLEFVEGKITYDKRYAENIDELLAAGKHARASEGEMAILLLDKRMHAINRDGTGSQTVHKLVKILNQRGARRFASEVVWYLVGEQRVKVKTARVHRTDGTVDEARITHGASPRRVNYSTYASHVISLPPLRVGDIVEIEYRLDDLRQSFFGDYFGHIQYFQGALPIGLAKYVLIVPADRAFFIHTRNTDLKPTITEEEDARVYVWQMRDVPRLKAEPLMPSAAEALPQVQVSTYKDWGEFGRWYWNLIKAQHTTNAELSAKVKALTRGRTTTLEKIRAIYNYVVMDIRYVAWEFGVHGFQPYRASQIFDRKFGDCKDKATLLNTMLAQLGVQSYPVLIRAEDRRAREDLSMPLIRHFNHCISYVPAGKDHGELWLDGTAMYHNLETLPSMDRGATVCVVTPEGGKLHRIGPAKPGQNWTLEKAEFRLQIDEGPDGPQGNAYGTVSASAGGQRAIILRHYAHVKEKQAQLLGRLYGDGASVSSVQTSDFLDLDTPVTLRYDVTLTKFMKREGDAWTLHPVPHPLRGTLQQAFPERLSSYAERSERMHDLLLVAPWRHETEQTFELPAGFAVRTLPRGAKLDTPFGSYHVSYAVRDGKLHVKRLIELAVNRVSAADYRAFRAFCTAADREEQKRVVIGAVRP